MLCALYFVLCTGVRCPGDGVSAFDPLIPPWLAEIVTRTLPHKPVSDDSQGAHNSYECVENLVADFIEGTTASLVVSYFLGFSLRREKPN